MQRPRRLSRRARRLVVLATFLAYPAINVGYAVLFRFGALPTVSQLWAPVAIVLMFGFAAGVAVIYAVTRSRAEPSALELDERQRDLAIRARALSYGLLLTFIVALAGLWAVTVTLAGPVTLGPEWLLTVAIVVGVYLPILPSAVLAWIEPDAPPEDLATAAETVTTPVGGAIR
jgi:hypothetical protein